MNPKLHYLTRLINIKTPKIKPFLVKYSESLLLYLPLLFLIFPQESGFFHARAIFWLYPFLFFFVIISKKRKVGKNFKTYSSLWLLFFASMFLSTINSASHGLSIIKAAEYLGVFLYSIYFYLIIDTKQKLIFFSNLLFLTGIILVSLSLYFNLIIKDSSIGGINLFYPSHGHNHISSFLLLILPLVLVRALTAKKKKLIIGYWILVIALSGQFFLSFSRASLLVLPIPILIIVWKLKPTLKKLIPTAALALIPLSLLITLLIFPFVSSKSDLSRTYIKTHWLWRQTIKPITTETRFAYWQQSLDSFKDCPVFGYGPGTFRLVSKLYRHRVGDFSSFAHNSFLQVLAEQGLLGLITFSLLLLFIFTKLFNSFKTFSHAQLALSLGLLALLLHSLFDFDFDFLLLSTLFFSISALLIQQKPNLTLSKTHKTYLFLISLSLFIFGLLFTASQALIIYGNKLKVSNPQKSLQAYTLATNLFPFDPHVITSTLSQTKELSTDLPPNLLTNIDLFHHQSPSVQLSLTQYYLGQKNYERYRQLSLTLIKSDPLHLSSHQKYFKIFLDQKNSKAIGEALFLLINTKSLSNSFNQNDFISPPLTTHYSSELFDTLNKDLIEQLALSKIYYYLGLSVIDQDPGLTRKLWLLTTHTFPQGGYFHAELASLEQFIFKDKSSAMKILLKCKNYSQAKPHCVPIIEDFEKMLPPPGEIEFIIREAY